MLKRPERLVGMHFFNPPVMMKLVEVIREENNKGCNSRMEKGTYDPNEFTPASGGNRYM